MIFSPMQAIGGLALLLAIGGARPPGLATDPVCVTEADTVRPHLERLEWIVTHSSQAILAGAALPSNPPGGVTVVSDEVVCSRARTAFNSRLVGSDTALAATRVIVLRAADRFVVTAAIGPQGSGWRSSFVYDTTFTFLRAMAGS